MASGVIVAESLRAGTKLARSGFVVHEVERVAPTDISPAQRHAGIPSQWTLLRFELRDDDAESLASALSEALDALGWYADFHTATETFVVFANRTFRYRTGDQTARAEAEAYAREHGVPEEQLDWP